MSKATGGAGGPASSKDGSASSAAPSAGVGAAASPSKEGGAAAAAAAAAATTTATNPAAVPAVAPAPLKEHRQITAEMAASAAANTKHDRPALLQLYDDLGGPEWVSTRVGNAAHSVHTDDLKAAEARRGHVVVRVDQVGPGRAGAEGGGGGVGGVVGLRYSTTHYSHDDSP